LKYLYIFLAVLLFAGVGEIFYLKNLKIDPAQKREVVKVLTMPDLSISTEAHFTRHRSITDLYEVFGLGPSLFPYFPSDFVYAPPPYLNAKRKQN
jgi:hypothetical protein